MSGSIVFFDGVCNLCNASVRFIIKRDDKEQFKFASLQSAYAHNVLESLKATSSDLSSIVLIEEGEIHTQSTAALRIVKNLSGLWPVLYGFIIVPKFLRDMVYNWIARNRYKWFGKQDQCAIPTPELQSRFLD